MFDVATHVTMIMVDSSTCHWLSYLIINAVICNVLEQIDVRAHCVYFSNLWFILSPCSWNVNNLLFNF